MKEGLLDANTAMAPTAQQKARNHKSRASKLEDESSIQVSTAGVRGASVAEGRQENKSGDGSNDPSTSDKPRAKKTVLPVRADEPGSKRASKRLTPAAEARLRTPIGELDDKHKAKRPSQVKQPDIASRQALALKSYNYGYDSGYAAGKNTERRLQRYVEREAEGATPGNVKLWQCSAAVLTGMLIGMLFALFTKGL